MGNSRLDSSSSSVQLCHRGSCGSSVDAVDIELAQVAVQDLTWKALCEDVGWIAIALYLEQCKVASSQSFLDLQLAYSQMAYSANSASPAYADCCGRVGMNPDVHCQAEIQSPGLDAERFCSALHQAVQFGFCGAKGHCALCA